MKRTNKSVYVYFNLHRKLWSVQSRKTQRVLYHTDVCYCTTVSLLSGKLDVSVYSRRRGRTYMLVSLVNLTGLTQLGVRVGLDKHPSEYRMGLRHQCL